MSNNARFCTTVILTHANQGIINNSSYTTVYKKPPCIFCGRDISLSIQGNLDICVSAKKRSNFGRKKKDYGVNSHLLKYSTRPSIKPIKHSAQHARQTSAARNIFNTEYFGDGWEAYDCRHYPLSGGLHEAKSESLQGWSR